MFAPGDRFLGCWTEIWPVIAPVYEECLLQTPTRLQRKVERKEDHKEKKKHKRDAMDEDKDNAEDLPGETPLQKKIRAVVEDFKKGRKENRGKYMNLAYTKPTDNSKLQDDLTYGGVGKMLIDRCMNVAAAGNVDNGELVAASAGDGDELDGSGVNSRSISEPIRALHGYTWQIPEAVEKGFEIPIAITSLDAMPVPGEFKRLAMDVVVNAI